jgi:hypothetical protein
MSKLHTRPQLWAALRERGFPIADSTGDKLCALGQGPPVNSWWGRRALHGLDEGIAWAQSRLSPTRGRLPGVPQRAPKTKSIAQKERSRA